MTKRKLKQQNEIMRKALLEIAGGTYDPDETIPDENIQSHLFAARAAIRRIEGKVINALHRVEMLESSGGPKWTSCLMPVFVGEFGKGQTLRKLARYKKYLEGRKDEV